LRFDVALPFSSSARDGSGRATADAPKGEEREGGQGRVVAGLKAPRYKDLENA
jgi:hypothetical protein